MRLTSSFLPYYSSFLVFLAVFVAETGFADQDKTKCNREAVPSLNGLTPCKISWTFADEGAEFDYWVQRLDVTTEATNWVNIYGPARQRIGSTMDPVDGGFLYRVVACPESPNKLGVACRPSSAIWAPRITNNHEDIPNFLFLEDGTKVSAKPSASPHDEPIELLNIEYNIALIQVMVSHADKSLLPSLTELGFANVHDLPEDIGMWNAYMDFNVRVTYPIDPIDPHAPPHIP